MTFDMQAAREICDELLHPGEDCGADCQFCDEAKTLLPAALDRIDELESALIAERDRYLVDFIHEYDDVLDCKQEAIKQLQAEGKL